MGFQEMISEYFGDRSLVRNLIIVFVAGVIVMGITFFLISIGYGIIAAFLGMILAIVFVIYFAYKQWTKYKHMDAMKAGFDNLYSGTHTFNFSSPVILRVAKSEAATLSSFLGWCDGRTVAPVDKQILTYMMPEDKKKEFKDADVALDDLIWVLRVKPHSKELPQNILVLCADSQISDLSRDATGDFQFGSELLLRGHLMRYGPFFICLDKKYSVSATASAAESSAIMAVLSSYINRYSQLTAVDVKTKLGIVEQRVLKKKEAEIIEEN